jgi:hypothetical protein
MERGHELVVRVERNLRHPRIEAAGPVDVDAPLGRQHDQCRLGRIAHDLAVRHARVVRERHREQEGFQRRLALAGDVEDPPVVA